jgi:hypothetical protein
VNEDEGLWCFQKRCPERTTEERYGGARSRRIIYGVYCSASQVAGGERRCSQPCAISTVTSSIRWGLHRLVWLRDRRWCHVRVSGETKGFRTRGQHTEHTGTLAVASGIVGDALGSNRNKKKKKVQKCANFMFRSPKVRSVVKQPCFWRKMIYEKDGVEGRGQKGSQQRLSQSPLPRLDGCWRRLTAKALINQSGARVIGIPSEEEP